MLSLQGLPQLPCKLRLTRAVGTAQDLIHALGDIAHDFHRRLIPFVDVRRGAVDVHDGHIRAGTPFGRCTLHDVVTDGDDHVRAVKDLVDIILLGNADGPQAVLVIHGHHTLGHHGVDHRDMQPIRHFGNGGRGVGADRAGAHEDDRVLCLGNDPARRCNMSGVGVKIVHLLALQGHRIRRHFGDVLGQVDVGGTGLAFLGVLEGQADDLAHRVGADDLLGALGDGLKQGAQIEVLVAGQLHTVGAHLAGDGHQRCAVQIRIGHAGDEVGGTRPQGGQADACVAGQAAVHIGHKSSSLLVAGGDEADLAVPDGKHQVQRFLTGDAEDHIHALGFQTVHQDLCSVLHGGCFFLHSRSSKSLALCPNKKAA